MNQENTYLKTSNSITKNANWKRKRCFLTLEIIKSHTDENFWTPPQTGISQPGNIFCTVTHISLPPPFFFTPLKVVH